MPDRIIGHRNASEDEWHWGLEQIPGPRRSTGTRGPRGPLLLAAIGAALVSVGVILLVLSTDNSDSQSSATRSPVARPSGAPTSVSPKATDVPTDPPTSSPASPSQSPSTSGAVSLFVWSRQDNKWLESDNGKDEPGYREGEAVPFMLRIEDTVSTGVYDVALEYECKTNDGAAFDYLTSVSDPDRANLMTPPAPTRREDSSILIPDDPSITLDGGRRFIVWGGSFEEIPEGPTPTGQCETEKRVGLSLRAQGNTLFLIWGAHLASSGDWGGSGGASSQQSPIHVDVNVNQSGAKRLGVGPGAIAP